MEERDLSSGREVSSEHDISSSQNDKKGSSSGVLAASGNERSFASKTTSSFKSDSTLEEI